MKCEYCGAELKDGAKFCNECGAKVEPEIKTCPNCGAKLDNNEKFCHECGIKIETDADEITEEVEALVDNSTVSEAAKASNPQVKYEAFDYINLIIWIGSIIVSIVFVVKGEWSNLFGSVGAFVFSIIGIGFAGANNKHRNKKIIFAILAVLCSILCGMALFGNKKNSNANAIKEANSSVYAENLKAASSRAAARAASSKASYSKSTVSADSVDPKLKRFLDEYEDFMDSYIAFMQNVDMSDMQALSAYSQFMSDYADYMDALADYDTGSMSTADLQYYMEVTNRVSQKLLAASL